MSGAVKGEQRASEESAAGAASLDRTPVLALAKNLLGRYANENAAWHYEHALFLRAAREAGTAWGDRALAGRAEIFMGLFVGPDGEIATYRTDDYNLDQVNPGRNLFDLLPGEADGRYRKAIESLREQLRRQPRTKSGGFWHKKIYPYQMWLDGLYMAEPFYARYAKEFGEAADFDDVARQFSLMEERARDPRTGLLYHAWDESGKQLWANPETGCSPHFWGRAMGWYAMALVDVLDSFPREHASRPGLVGALERLARALLAYQDPETGLWYQVVDQGGRAGNYLEASVSAMLAYALAKGSRLGYLREPLFAEAGSRAYRGCRRRFLKVRARGEVSFEGTCSVAGLGGNPYRDGSYEYYVREPVRTDDYKGVGPFVLAAVEYGRGEAGA